MGRLLNFLPLRTKVYSIFEFAIVEKEKYFNVCLTHWKNKPLSYWYWASSLPS